MSNFAGMTLMGISAIVVAALLVGLAAGLAIGVRIGRGRGESDDSDRSDYSDGSDRSDDLDHSDGRGTVGGGDAHAPGEVPAADREQMERLTHYIEEHMQRSELSVEELSEYMGMSRVHLYRKVKGATGRTPIDLIRVLRLKRAARLLKDEQCSITEVALRVGFNSPRIFSRYFREEYGVIPSEYRDNA